VGACGAWSWGYGLGRSRPASLAGIAPAVVTSGIVGPTVAGLPHDALRMRREEAENA
jgi:hypothetical protein